MSKPEIPLNNPEQNAQQFETIIQHLHSLAVAVAALPDSQLLIGNPETGPVAFLKVSPEKGLTVRYKPEVADHVQEPDTATALPSPQLVGDSRSPAKEVEGRVSLWGRLGTDPRFNNNPDGGLVARFPLAVPVEGQPRNANWVDVVAFKKTAQKLQQTGIGKGRGVEIIGYWHEKTTKSGKSKPGKELYAAVIKPADKPGREK